MTIFVTDTAKTKAKATLQKRRNLFGLGVTSLIAACAGDEAGNDDTKSIISPVVTKTPAGPVGDRPTKLVVPAKLSVTAGQLAETSIEKLAPVADIDSDHISASTPVSDPVRIDPDDSTSTLNDLVVTINEAAGLVDNNVEITFKNGNHTADPLVSVYQLKEGTNDLVVTSAGFGDPSGANIRGAIYIFWDIKERTSLDNADTASNNFLKVESTNTTEAIGQYAPNFFHIGGDAQYDMVFGGYDGANADYLYIVWDVAKYAGASSAANQSINVRSTAAVPHGLLRIDNNYGDESNIAKHSPEFFHLGGADSTPSNMPQYDMVIRAVGDGTSNNQDRIHILWDINEYDDGVNSVPKTVLLNDKALVRLSIIESYLYGGGAVTSNIAKHAPEFLQIGGADGAGHDMVIRSEDDDGDNTAIYILWDVAEYFSVKSSPNMLGEEYKFIFLKDSSAPLPNGDLNYYANKGLLQITAGENIGKYSPDFAQIGGDKIGGVPQQDMIIRSEDDTGAIYILWDVNKHYNSITIDSGRSSTLALPLSGITATNGLKIIGATGENIGAYSPELFELAGTDTQDEMVIRSDTAIYVLWDVAAHYNVRSSIDLSSNSAANGLLKITGADAENIGAYSPEFLQIGGVDASGDPQHDMVIRSDTAIYVLWDVAEYHSATPTPINLSTNDGITKGLLKITGTTASEKIGQNAPDILKINNNDDYDMIIKSDTNMYVLWDFTKDYSATTPASVSLTAAAASTGNGLLTISGAGTADVLKNGDGSFLDINDADNGDNNINDLVFTDGGNTFILFGEKIAYRDKDGKAVSDTVNLTAIKALNFGDTDAGFFSYDKVVTPTSKADLAGVVGYRFADAKANIGTVKADYESLGTGTFPPALSDADAVWDIA